MESVVIKIIYDLETLICLCDVSRGSTPGNRLQSNGCFRSNNRLQVNELSGRRGEVFSQRAMLA